MAHHIRGPGARGTEAPGLIESGGFAVVPPWPRSAPEKDSPHAGCASSACTARHRENGRHSGAPAMCATCAGSHSSVVADQVESPRGRQRRRPRRTSRECSHARTRWVVSRSPGRAAASVLGRPEVDRAPGTGGDPPHEHVPRAGAGAHSPLTAPPSALRPQPLEPVVAMPSTKCRCPRKNSTIIGTVAITLAVTTISQCHSPPKPNWSSIAFSPRGIVKVLESRR